MSELRIKLKGAAKLFVENCAARMGRSPDEVVHSVIEDFELAMEKRKLDSMLMAGYQQLRQGKSRVMTEQDWNRLENRVTREPRRTKK